VAQPFASFAKAGAFRSAGDMRNEYDFSVRALVSLRGLGRIARLCGMAEAMPFPSNRAMGCGVIDSVLDDHGFGGDGFPAGCGF
jgi:hypothetical protein